MRSVKPKQTVCLSPTPFRDSVPPQTVHEAVCPYIQIAYVETALVDSFLQTSNSNPLAFICFDQKKQLTGKRLYPVIHLHLPQLQDPLLAEVWMSPLPITYRNTEGMSCSMNEQILFGSLELEESPGASLEAVTYTAYCRLLTVARTLGYPHLLRIWNYFPRINFQSNGLERYQQFCIGRHEAFAENQPDFHKALPAATAVGTKSGPLQIYFLAGTKPGAHVENPRQVNAYEYPSIYGPRSPSFARATLRKSEAGNHLFIAGTASIVGHTSRHLGEPEKQTLETLHNLQALIDHAQELQTVRNGQGQALFKAYIRRPEHVATAKAILTQRLPAHAQVLCLEGAPCRNELLVEIEGILASGSERESP